MENMIIVVNKEKEYTSRDVVNKIGHILNTKKVGHTGTLDPLATGVLVVTVGKYTKLNDALTSTYKEYEAEFVFGKETDTLDITGKVLNEKNIKISEEELKTALKNFTGKYMQEVPIYSAVKVDGKKLYEYARQGEYVSLPKKEVDIKELELLSYNDNMVSIRCLVSKGTYIRSLIRDIGEYLNTYATMTNLNRTKQGIFDIKDSYTLKDIEEGNYKYLTIKDCLDVEIIDNYPYIKSIENGAKISYDSVSEYLLFLHDDKELALYKKDDEIYRMYIKLD